MAFLKAIRIDKIQANYQITPDTIANVIGYIISGIFHSKKELTILDPAMGTANLLTAIYHQLETSIGVTPTISGIENDDAMFELAADSVELQKFMRSCSMRTPFKMFWHPLSMQS